MPASLEKAPSEKKDWGAYFSEMTHLVEAHEPSALEELLLEDHPVMPGELEAFQWLEENLGRKSRLRLDESGYHVVPQE